MRWKLQFPYKIFRRLPVEINTSKQLFLSGTLSGREVLAHISVSSSRGGGCGGSGSGGGGGGSSSGGGGSGSSGSCCCCSSSSSSHHPDEIRTSSNVCLPPIPDRNPMYLEEDGYDKVDDRSQSLSRGRPPHSHQPASSTQPLYSEPATRGARERDRPRGVRKTTTASEVFVGCLLA